MPFIVIFCTSKATKEGDDDAIVIFFATNKKKKRRKELTFKLPLFCTPITTTLQLLTTNRTPKAPSSPYFHPRAATTLKLLMTISTPEALGMEVSAKGDGWGGANKIREVGGLGFRV
jgi:hypothetical protein